MMIDTIFFLSSERPSVRASERAERARPPPYIFFAFFSCLVYFYYFMRVCCVLNGAVGLNKNRVHILKFFW